MESVVTGLDGVESAKADYRKGTAVVVYDRSKLTPEQIANQINTQTYYRARVTSEFVKTARFKLPGLDSQEEAQKIELALSGVEGIVGGSLNVESLSLDYDVRETSPEQIVELINSRTSFTASFDTSGGASASRAGSTATAVIRVEGMVDDQTASQATGALLLDGVVDGSVNIEDATLTIVYDTAKLTAQKIVDTLRQAVPNTVSLVSVSEPRTGGGVLSSGWFILSLVGLAVFAVFAGPPLKRRLQAELAGGKSTPRRRQQRPKGRR